MANSIATQDQRPAEVFAALTIEWARQTARYSHSVRLFQKHVSGRRPHRPRALGRAAPPEPKSSRQPAYLRIVERPDEQIGGPTTDATTTEPSHCPSRSPLTDRQLEIAGLIAQGLTNGQIAARIIVSRGTVGNHIGHMLRRLGMNNRAQIAAWMAQRTHEAGVEHQA